MNPSPDRGLAISKRRVASLALLLLGLGALVWVRARALETQRAELPSPERAAKAAGVSRGPASETPDELALPSPGRRT